MGSSDEVLKQSETAFLAGDFAGAVRHAKLAAELEPENRAAWGHLAEALLELNKHDEALSAAEQCLRLDPSSTEALKLKANAEFMGGDVDAGLESLRRAAESGSWMEKDYANALLRHDRFDEAEPVITRIRSRYDEDEDTAGVDRLEAVFLHDRALHNHWVGVDGEEGARVYLPTSYEAIGALQSAIDQGRQLNPTDGVIRELTDNAQSTVDDQLMRRYGGGFAVPIASFLIGALMLAVGSGNSTVVAIGIIYLLCAGLYVHAARVQTYRINVRRANGEEGGGGFLNEMRTGKSFGERSFGFLFGFVMLGLVSPVVVLYHYGRNYAFK